MRLTSRPHLMLATHTALCLRAVLSLKLPKTYVRARWPVARSASEPKTWVRVLEEATIFSQNWRRVSLSLSNSDGYLTLDGVKVAVHSAGHTIIKHAGATETGEPTCNTEQEMDDVSDGPLPSRQGTVPGYIPVELILQHAHYNTSSIFRVEFPLNIPVRTLKIDLEKRLKIPPDKQKWFYKGVIMEPYDTMLNRKVKVDDKIVVKEGS